MIINKKAKLGKIPKRGNKDNNRNFFAQKTIITTKQIKLNNQYFLSFNELFLQSLVLTINPLSHFKYKL